LAKAADKTCSNATIKGAFVRRDTGFVIAPNGAIAPLSGVALLTFDGNGRFTATGFTNLNGTPHDPSTSQGRYFVNSDCTGGYEPDIAPPGRTGKGVLMIVDGGNGIEILPRDQSAALTCVARRVFPVGDSQD
jgi:hypothetical protein